LLAWKPALGLLRRSEWTCLGYFLYIALLSFFFPVSKRRCGLIAFVNLLIGTTFWALPGGVKLTSPLFISVVRDWLPAPLIVLAYHEAGLLTFPRADRTFERMLLGWDKRLRMPASLPALPAKLPTRLEGLLEFSYLMVYPIVPLGLAALYLAHLGRFADQFWSVVLPAVFVCYGLTPWFPALPPRRLLPDNPKPEGLSRLRRLNLWMLDRTSIQANTFPSAHVAGAAASSLALLIHLPLLGACYLCITLGIGIGAMRGRYHYAIDVLMGALAGILAFVVATML
jgi:membrane-associated phospholipid phosphatase